MHGVGGYGGLTPNASPAATPGGAGTPAPAQGGGQAPTGTSPVAKRPLQRHDVAMATDDGPSQAMSAEDLTAGFYNLVRERDRDSRVLLLQFTSKIQMPLAQCKCKCVEEQP